MSDGLSEAAKRIAAKATGLREDQVAQAIGAYRSALEEIAPDTAEPEWRAVWHMSGPETGIHQYCADGTKVALQINSWKSRDEWKQERIFTLDGKPYADFTEPRTIELERDSRPTPYAIDDVLKEE